jgi:hypothetical protein
MTAEKFAAVNEHNREHLELLLSPFGKGLTIEMFVKLHDILDGVKLKNVDDSMERAA